MRPVVVCHSTIAGGAERYLTNLYGRLARRGHEPQLLGSVPGWAESGLPVHPIPLGPKWNGRSALLRLPRVPAERRAVARAAGSAAASLFHVQFKREQIALTSVLAEHAPVIWTEHGRFTTGFEGRLYAEGYRRAARAVSAIVCVSDLVARDVREIVGPNVRVEVIHNAIDTSVVTPPSPAERRAARAELDIPAGEPVIAWVGQVHHGKLPLLAAGAAARFAGTTVLAGDGELAGELSAATAGNRRVRYVGYQPDPGRLLRAADLFLFTSAGRNEGLPTNSMLEAAAHGLPVVANRGSGFGAEAEAVGGLLADDDPDALAAAATTVASELSNRSATALRWARAHDLEPWAGAHEALFRSLV